MVTETFTATIFANRRRPAFDAKEANKLGRGLEGAYALGREAKSIAEAALEQGGSGGASSFSQLTGMLDPTQAGINPTPYKVLYGNGTWAPAGGGLFVSVLEFGAVGDGTTNDSPAIQAALNAAGQSGAFGGTGRVWFPGGRTYGIGTTLRLPANIILDGGPAARLLSTNGTTMMVNYVAGDTTTTAYNGRGNITVRNLTMDMRGHEQTVAHNCLTFSHAENLWVENVVFRNVSSYHHLEFNACRRARAVNCMFEGWKNNTGSSTNNYREAVQIDYAIGSTTPGAQDNTPCRDIVIEGCWFGASQELGPPPRAIGSHTVASGGAPYSGIKIINNTMEGCTLEAVRAYSWRNSVIENNVILEAGAAAIALDAAPGVSATNVVVAGNSISNGCSVAAIVLRSTNSGANTYSNVTFSGNTINSIAGTGILLDYTNHVVVTGNKINGVDGGGINLTNGSGSNISGNALVTVGGYGISVADGRQHTIIGNYLWGVTGQASIYVAPGASYALVSSNNVYSASTAPYGVYVNADSCAVLGNHLNVARDQVIRLTSVATKCAITGNVAAPAAASTWVSYATGVTAYMTSGDTLSTPNIIGSNVVHG